MDFISDVYSQSLQHADMSVTHSVPTNKSYDISQNAIGIHRPNIPACILLTGSLKRPGNSTQGTIPDAVQPKIERNRQPERIKIE